MRKIELLVPASSLEVLKIAVVFGADAVYIGGEAFGLRAKAKNFSKEDMAEGIAFAHEHGVKGMVGWAKENAAASGLADAPIRWLVDDCMKFVEREIRRGNKYDGIIMDPPSYGRGPKGEIWKIEDNIWDFVGLTAQLLSDDALFFLINSYTTGLQPAVLSYMMNSTLTKKFGGHVEAEEIGLPVTESGLVLPCGASGRWQRK